MNIIKNKEFKKQLQEGDSFGELALLYEAPRAASVKAMTFCKLFALRRDVFKNAVKQIAIRNMKENLEIISKILLFGKLVKRLILSFLNIY